MNTIYSKMLSMLCVPCLLCAACSEESFDADPARDWAGTSHLFVPTDDAGFNTYYKPAVGRVGDAMPFYDPKVGDFKVLYLQEYDNNGPCYHPYWGVSTRDGANYASLGEVLPAGTSTAQQDASLGTGCALYDEEDGLYYIYYTGYNVLLPNREVVMRATSPDFKNWKRDNAWQLKGADYGYSSTDFRDPQVFTAEDGFFHLIVSTRPAGSGNPVFAEFKSADLKTWEHVGQFPMIWNRFLECPDIFKMGDWWYMVYSDSYKENWCRKVKYKKASTYEGLKACFDGSDAGEAVLDSRAFYAAKTASNGTDRYIWGWCPYRTGSDLHEKNTNVGGGTGNEPNWSGALVCHKVVQHADGSLTLGKVPTMDAKYNKPQAVTTMAANGSNAVPGASVPDAFTLSGNDAYTLFSRLGTCNHISFTVATSNNWDRFGISFVRSTDTDFYYTIVVNPEDENHRKLNFEQEGYRLKLNDKGEEEKVNGKGFIEGIDGYWFERLADNTYHIDIYTDNSVLTLYINDVCAYTQRIYGIQKNCWSINNYGGSVTVRDVKVSQQ